VIAKHYRTVLFQTSQLGTQVKMNKGIFTSVDLCVLNSIFTPNTPTNSLFHPLAIYSIPQCIYAVVCRMTRDYEAPASLSLNSRQPFISEAYLRFYSPFSTNSGIITREVNGWLTKTALRALAG
jgi:hypothetical protein